VTRAEQGGAGVRALLKGLVTGRVSWIWYLVALLGPLALLLAGRLVTGLFGFTDTPPAPSGPPLALGIQAFVMALFANPWEEVGWRGFALPRLQGRYNALVATLIVGVLWGLWHLPLFFWAGNPMAEYPFLPWFTGIVAGAFLYTWLYNSTQGSLLLVALFHVALNTFGVLVAGVSITALAIVYCSVAVALVAVFGSANLSRQEKQVRMGHLNNMNAISGTR
jgi:membrane protease YdiL (CAAX protease family)